MNLRYTLLLLSATPLIVTAAPPPGHPSPAQAMDWMRPEKAPAPEQLRLQGKVLSTMPANEYTYIELETDQGTVWLAAPRMDITVGGVVRYENGFVMTNFYSKLLQRTFPRVLFTDFVVPVK